MTGVAAEVGAAANNYQILARLATGGMAEIFLARGVSATGVERYVVLKRILRERATDASFVRMFLDEARLACQLQHPNVAQVYDTGKLGDSYFFTMEYVHGETVRSLLHRARSLRRDVPLGAVLTVIAGAAAGLHHAHERLGHDGRPLGIVHRDVSPSNLMISYEGNLKVVDFGVAKAENRSQETRSGTVKGKIAYLSPEQCRGGGIDRRSDLFSLGIVFWEMLTTERLYKRASDFDNMTAIVTEAPPPPSARRAGLPAELDRIVLRLLSKDPNARFQTGDELVEALEEAGVKAGTMLSPSAVGRFMRELFGQRPEPWLELDTTQQVALEGVTITSEPLPPDAVEPAIPVDVPHKPSEGLTAPARPVAQAPIARPPDEHPRLEFPLAPPPPSEVIPGRALRSPSIPPIPSTPAPIPLSASGSHGAYVVPAPAKPARSWPLFAIIAGAAVIGSLTVWIVMRTGSTVTFPDAATAIPIAVVDAGEHIEMTATAAPDAEAAAATGPGDAAVAAVAADAAVVESPDAAVDALAAAIAANAYAQVVTLCSNALGEHAADCVVAACQTRNEGKARAWIGRASGSAKRAAIARCREAGVELVPKVVVKPPATPPVDAGVVDKCAQNPMACQR